MTSLNIQLPDHLRNFLEAEAAAGGYDTAEDYVYALIWGEQKRRLGGMNPEAREQFRQQQLAELRADIQIGIDQADRGEFSTRSIEDLIAEGHRSFNQGPADGEEG